MGLRKYARVTPDGAFAYVTNSRSSIEGVARAGGSTPSSTTNRPRFDSFSNSVSVIHLASNTVTATVGVGGGPVGLAITPDGAFAYITNSDSSNVSVIDLASNTVTATVAVGNNPFWVAITP